MYNSTQIFKTSVEVTGTLYEASLRGYSNELERLRTDKSRDHQMKIERALLNGVRVGGTGMGDANDNFNNHQLSVNSKTVRTTMGVISCLRRYGSTTGDQQNKFSITMSSYDYDALVDDTEKIFRNVPSTGRKTAFCGGGALSFWSKIAANGFLGNNGATIQLSESYMGAHGYYVTELITPHGRIDLVNAPVLRGVYNNTMVVIDPDNVQLVEYRGDRFDVNIKQDDGYDGYKDQFFSDLGLGVAMIETHSLWTFS